MLPLKSCNKIDYIAIKAEVHSSIITTPVREQRPKSHHKGATGWVPTVYQLYPVLCHCQLGQDIYCLHKQNKHGMIDPCKVIKASKSFAKADICKHTWLKHTPQPSRRACPACLTAPEICITGAQMTLKSAIDKSSINKWYCRECVSVLVCL